MYKYLLLLGLALFATAFDPDAPNECVEELTWATGTCITGTTVPGSPLEGYCFQDFNVISFGDFNAYRGDIEGRLFVAGDTFIDPDGFSVGLNLKTSRAACEDAHRDYSFVMGGDSLCWSHGSLFPDGTNIPYVAEREGFFAPDDIPVSDCFPIYMDQRQEGTCPLNNPDCLVPSVNFMEDYYCNLVDTWNNAAINTKWMVEYDVGLIIKSLETDPEATLYVSIPKKVWNYITYVKLENIPDPMTNPPARIIITITEPNQLNGEPDCSPIFFGMGSEFPYDERKLAFSFPTELNGCEERKIVVDGGMRGSIVAPFHTYVQTQGVTKGFIIVQTVEKLHQANKLECAVCPQICNEDCCRTDLGFQCCENTTCCDTDLGECCGTSCGCGQGGDDVCCTTLADGLDDDTCCDKDLCCSNGCCEDSGDNCCEFNATTSLCCDIVIGGDSICCDDPDTGFSQCCVDQVSTGGDASCCGQSCPCPAGLSCCADANACCNSPEQCCGPDVNAETVCCEGSLPCCNVNGFDTCCDDANPVCCGEECCPDGARCCDGRCCLEEADCCQTDASGNSSACCDSASNEVCCGDGTGGADDQCCPEGVDGMCCGNNCPCTSGAPNCCNDGDCCDTDCCGDVCCGSTENCCDVAGGDICCADSCCDGDRNVDGDSLCCDHPDGCCETATNSTCCEPGQNCCREMDGNDDLCCDGPCCSTFFCCEPGEACCPNALYNSTAPDSPTNAPSVCTSCNTVNELQLLLAEKDIEIAKLYTQLEVLQVKLKELMAK